MAARDVIEVVVDGPDLALVVLEDQEAHWPINAGGGIGSDELRSERRITKNEKRRWIELDTGIGSKLGLVDFVPDHELLGWGVLLQAMDRLGHRVGALDAH